MSTIRSTTAERRFLAGQQLFFFIGILINAILLIAPRGAHPDISSVSAEMRQRHKETDAYTVTRSVLPKYPPAAGPPQDSSKWVSIIIVCGNGETNTVREMEPLLKSAILLSSAPLHFVFVTDQQSSNRIKRIFQEELQYSKKPLRVDAWILAEESVMTFSSILDYNPTYHHSGVWGTSKLMLPWIVRDLDKAVQIDTDMIFLDDPARIWSEFDDSEWLYKMPLHNTDAPYSICSCIVLLKLAKVRQSNTFPTLMEEALASQPEWKGNGRLYNTPNGDQGLYWALLTKDNSLVAPLPERWNVDRCHDYFGVFKPGSEGVASVMHNNCDDTNSFGMAKDYFTFYEKYKWHWLKGDGSSSEHHQVNVTIHPAETSRLQELFHCLKKNGNHTQCES